MSEIAAVTIVARNYVPFARVLAQSLHGQHPQIPLFVLVVDRGKDPCDLDSAPLHPLDLAEIGIPRLPAFLFRYSRQQAVVAAKPYAVRRLLDRGFSSVIYLDADMLAMDDITAALETVRRRTVTLSPHFLAPLTGETRAARELHILMSGTYNGGFIGFSKRPETRRFLEWWQERLWDRCDHDPAQSLLYDQRWLDFAPSLVEDFHVLRDPGVNVAYWNLPERGIRLGASATLADGSPCRLFHFSGFDPGRPSQVTRYMPDLKMDEIGEAAPLFSRYAALLDQAGLAGVGSQPYGFDRFSNGVPIPAAARQLYRDLGPEAERFPDPANHHGDGSFYGWLNEPVDGRRDRSRAVTRFWHAIYKMRPDLERAFPAVLGADRDRFLRWTVRHGLREHGVPDEFVAHLSIGLRAWGRLQRRSLRRAL